MKGRYKKVIVGVAATVGATACGLMASGVAGAQEPQRGRAARHAGQPAVRHPGRRPRDLHAGRVRPGRDRLLPGEARRPRGVHELRHLRHRVRGLLPDRLPADVRRLLAAADRVRRTGRARRSSAPATGSSCSRAAGAAPARPSTPPAAWASSSTWWPSWTPWPRSPPGPWPSGGSGTPSSAGASSAAPSTTRSSVPGPGAAAGSPSSATPWSWGVGYADFAGSGVVHAVGGVAGLAGAHRPRTPHRQVQQGRLGQHPARPPHPDGHARHLHPAVRLVRLQRRLDLRSDRRALRRRGHQHGPRRCLRCGDGDVLHADEDGQARSRA